MQKGAGPMYADQWWPACSRRPGGEKSSRLRPGILPFREMKIGQVVWLGCCDYGAADQRRFPQAARKALRDQYRLSLGMSSRYSVIKPPVSSASREMSCSTHQFRSSSTIFSVEHGSQ